MEPFKTATTIEQPLTEAKQPGETFHINAPVDDLPPSLYREAHQPVLVAKELGLSPYYGDLSVIQLSEGVDSFICQEEKRLGLEDSVYSYRSILKSLEQKANTLEITDPFKKLAILNDYASILTKVRASSQEKEDILKADPNELSLDKLKQWLHLKGVKTI